MDNTTRMLKNVRAMGEAEYTKIVSDYAKRLYPDLSREQAFTKVFTADDAESAAIRKFWLIAKQGASDDETTDDEHEGESALDELNELAAEERRRNPKLSKAQSFTKVFTDPANARLAQRERAQNRPR